MRVVEPQVTIHWQCTSCVISNQVGISTAKTTNSEHSCVEQACRYCGDGSLILSPMIWAQTSHDINESLSKRDLLTLSAHSPSHILLFCFAFFEALVGECVDAQIILPYTTLTLPLFSPRILFTHPFVHAYVRISDLPNQQCLLIGFSLSFPSLRLLYYLLYLHQFSTAAFISKIF